jgi:hypothetical protein
MWSFINKSCGVAAAGIAVISVFHMGDNGSMPPSGDDEYTSSGAGGANGAVGGLIQRANIIPITDSMDSQQRAAAAVANGVLYNESHSKCARGANNILSYYYTGQGMATSGANANQMGPILEQRYGMTTVVDTGYYQNGDARLLFNGGYGHMEVYMNGRWYSDFAQNSSAVNWGKYGSSQLYRRP